MVAWASATPGVEAVGLAGSWARGDPGPTSDVDLVVLVDDISPWLRSSDWVSYFGDPIEIRDEEWGAVKARRVHYAGGLEAEFGLATRAWADVPLDGGTARVINDGFKMLYDPSRLLARAKEEARTEPAG